MGFNHWRKGWEIFGGCPEKGETMREAMMQEAKEELGIECIPEWLGLAHFEMQPDYFSNVVREEYGAVFGISSGEEIRELDRKLTEFY